MVITYNNWAIYSKIGSNIDIRILFIVVYYYIWSINRKIGNICIIANGLSSSSTNIL